MYYFVTDLVHLQTSAIELAALELLVDMGSPDGHRKI